MTWAQIHAQDRAALAAGVARYHDGSTVFLRYDDVSKLLSHPDAQLGYGSHQEQAGITEGLLHRFVTESFLAAPDADHARLRSLVSRAFTPRRWSSCGWWRGAWRRRRSTAFSQGWSTTSGGRSPPWSPRR